MTPFIQTAGLLAGETATSLEAVSGFFRLIRCDMSVGFGLSAADDPLVPLAQLDGPAPSAVFGSVLIILDSSFRTSSMDCE